ncbi:MAG: transglutaminase-like domain-containing protein [Planctomycetia bacterium]|nr:transglutaminase-like domain-containing protein [Planctomycetia bacterium]
MRRNFWRSGWVIFCLLLTNLCLAQFKDKSETAEEKGGVTLGESQTIFWECGFTIRAPAGGCLGVVATVPVPVDWNEQRVRVVGENHSPYAKVKFQNLPGGMRLMVVNIPMLPAGEMAEVTTKFEVTAMALEKPADTSKFVKADPKTFKPMMRLYLKPSEYIESDNREIRKLAREIGADAKTAWEEVEQVYDWIQEHIKFQNGKRKGALQTLKDGVGDSRELTALFAAICQAKKIPVRTVWFPEHCYSEFYLEDETGQGHWFPCQLAGDREFGERKQPNVILLKGDRFASMTKKGKFYRFLPLEVKTKGESRPTFSEVRRVVQE